MKNWRSNPAATSVHPPTPAFYDWAPPGRPPTVRLSLEVVDRLAPDVMKGFWSVPKRGAEVGGLLIGRLGDAEGAAATIEDYEPVPCEYRRGPSYMLSEADRRRFERALRKAGAGRQVVGFYRSHTRLGLYLDEHDFSLIRDHFTSPGHVFLLIRPDAVRPPTAGFFFWEEDHIHRQAAYLEFPFDRAEILKLSPWAHEAAAEAAPEAARPAASVARPEPVRPAQAAPRPAPAGAAPVSIAPRRLPLRRRTAAIAALAFLGFGLIEYAALKLIDRSGESAALAGSAPALRIERNGNYLQVNWNRQAPAILRAQRGVLSITDGAYRQDLELDPGQLRTGSIAYLPSGNDVSFRLELQGPKTAVTESLRVVSAPARPVQPVREARGGSAGRAAPAAAAKRPAAATAPGPVARAAPAKGEQEPVKKAQINRKHRRWYDDGL